MTAAAVQAGACAQRYSDQLSNSERQAVEALALLPTLGPMQRRLTIIRHRLWKKGFIRNCAMLVWV